MWSSRFDPLVLPGFIGAQEETPFAVALNVKSRGSFKEQKWEERQLIKLDEYYVRK